MVTGLDLHFLPLGENRGSHQCLHWWQELSTGQFHCYGFESAPPLQKEKRGPIWGLAFLGAGDRTRTGTLSPAVDFESTTSTYSITPAVTRVLYTMFFKISSRKNTDIGLGVINFRLGVVETCVNTVFFNQFIVGTAFSDHTVGNGYDAAGGTDGGQTVGDDQGGSAHG